MAHSETPSIDGLLRHSDWLKALARRLVVDPTAADDLVQDTWLAALRNPPAEVRSARAWLALVVRRLARAHSLRGARRVLEASRDDAPPTDEVVARIEQERLLARLVVELEEPYRSVLLRRFYSGLSAARIARIQGVPAATVRTQLRRALALLRERLDREHGTDRRGWPLAALFLARESGALEAVGKGALFMGTKTAVALSVACGALGTLVVTEGILPRLGDDPLHGRDLVTGAATDALLSATAPDSVESDAALDPGLPARVSPARQPLGRTELSPEDLRELLFSSDRIEQVRAIELLVAAGSVEANAVLLEAFFSTSDRVLLALLEEALLESTLDVAPALVNAFLESRDPERLGRVSGLLARLVSARPELAPEVTGHLLGALQEGSLFPERAGPATEVLVSLGIAAADGIGDYLTDRDSGPEGVGSAAWVLAQLPGEHGEVVREKLARSLQGSLDALGEWGLSAEEREKLLQKTGSIAWAATLRPEEEHDRLGEVVLESLLATRDAAQAGTLAWSLGNLEGLSARSRVGITGSLLEALDEEVDDSLRQQYLRTVEQLAVQQPIGPTFHELMRLVQEARALRGDDGELTPHLDRLLARLQAHEEQESTTGRR